MSERLPYEEDLKGRWDELTLPNEDLAWKDMKRRLEEDDDERVLIPPYRKGCGIGALLIALLLFGVAWWIVRPEKWFTGDDKNIVEERMEQQNTVKTDSTSIKSTVGENKTIPQSSKENTLTENKVDETKNNIQSNESLRLKNNPSETTKTSASTRITKPGVSNKPGKKQQVINKPVNTIMPAKQDRDESVTNVKVQEPKPDPVVTTPVSSEVVNNNKIDTATTIVPKKDSASTETKPAPDSAAKKPVTEPEKRGIFFAAGLGMHQQIPIAGQKLTTYGSLGRIGIITDYIPSVYFRMEKDRRWFIETGFRYGAPQYTKETTYDQVIQIDTVNQVTNIASESVKKTFYHQVPLAFNYYIKPNWTVGTGIVWNKFYSAVTEQEFVRRNNNSQTDTVLFKGTSTLRGADSAVEKGFSRSWTQAIFQTQYQWKRFVFGARYSVGLQPYIRFTLPNSPTQSEKNSSLQIFIKYELWKSKK